MCRDSRFCDYLKNLWDDFETIEEFLLCIPLKAATIMIATFGILYGLMGVSFFLSLLINFSEYQKVYSNKKDLLIFLIVLTGIVGSFFFTSILLMWGSIAGIECLVVSFLWSTLVHIFINLLMTLSIFIYCGFVNISCFQGSGLGMVVTSIIIIAMVYTFFWGYIIITVNSFRSEIY